MGKFGLLKIEINHSQNEKLFRIYTMTQIYPYLLHRGYFSTGCLYFQMLFFKSTFRLYFKRLNVL